VSAILLRRAAEYARRKATWRLGNELIRLNGTNDPAKAVQVDGRPQDNAVRNIWINETALSTALNASYMAEQTAIFGIVVGVALLLIGFGFAILAIGGALRNPDNALGLRFGDSWFMNPEGRLVKPIHCIARPVLKQRQKCPLCQQRSEIRIPAQSIVDVPARPGRVLHADREPGRVPRKIDISRIDL
jgi:hypothetical protein